MFFFSPPTRTRPPPPVFFFFFPFCPEVGEKTEKSRGPGAPGRIQNLGKVDF